MPSPEKDKPNLIENLVRQGVDPAEIQKVYRTLRDKGYGEEEARRRSHAALERLRVQKELEDRRRVSRAPAGSAANAARPAAGQPADLFPARQGAPQDQARRAVDWLPQVPGWLRRRINRYAYRNGFLITRFRERMDDALSVFDQSRPDFVNRALLRVLAEEKGYRGQNPFQLSFADNLDMLRDSALRLLGRPPSLPGRLSEGGADAVLRSLQTREPFAVEFFSVFTQPWDMLRRSLEFLGTSYRSCARVPVADLARVVMDGWRIVILTGDLEREKLETLFDVVRDANLAHTSAGTLASGQLLEAEGSFRAGYQNLRRFAHELYPALLKMMAAFYEEADESTAKAAAIREFLGVREEEILTWEGWQRRAREQKERELQERQARELARLEQEKVEKLGVRFEGTLATLDSLFPGSGVERMDQGEFLLPYFATRIFSRGPAFQARAADLERLSASDAMGLILVVHSLLDDLLSSLEPYGLEKATGKEGIGAALASLRGEWREAYPRLFEPYLDAVKEYARETEGDPRAVRQFREGARARSLEERINQLRNRAIRNFGHVVTERERADAPKLFEMATRLSGLLDEAGEVINQSTLAAADPVAKKVMEDLAASVIVDFEASSRSGTVDYSPVTRQIRRWIEARFRESVHGVPQKAQVAYLDVFRGVAHLYDALLNDARSPAAATGHGVATASGDERAAWARERSQRGSRGSQESLQATLMEQFPGQFVDALTGLKNKDFFLRELPRRLKELRAGRTPVTLLMMDIDHFKWVNDELGHERGDEVLKATASMVLDSIREGDLAVRYGGEEMLVVIPSDLHTGIILAERLRFAQEGRVLGREGMQEVREIGAGRGQPCGTLSVGVADVSAMADLSKAVEKADRALYAAKRTRNSVVYADPRKQAGASEGFTTYAEYRQKAEKPPG
jgi:diguanylate cyclase (GGDEF)-like protein